MKAFRLLAAGLVMLSAPAFATPVTYSFESSAYSSFSYSNGGPAQGYTLRGAYAPDDRLTIELTFESALPAGGNLSRGSPALLSAYAHDGINTFDAHDMYVDLVTDASGAVTEWNIGAGRGGPDFDGFTTLGFLDSYGITNSRTEVTYEDEYALTDNHILNVICQGNQTCFERERLFPFAMEIASASTFRDRATWTVLPAMAPVPVGGTLPFMATGLLALGAWRLRRKRAA